MTDQWRVDYQAVDITDSAAIEDALAATLKVLGGIDILRSIDRDVTRARDHLMAPGAKVVEAAGFRTASD